MNPYKHLNIGFHMKCIRHIGNILQASRLSFFLFSMALLTMNTDSLRAHDHSCEHLNELSTERIANKLETNFWTVVQTHKNHELSEIISPSFQGLGPSGAITREEEISVLEASTIESFSLQNMIATRTEDVLIITYHFGYTGTVLTNGPTLSVWKKGKKHWILVSHSFVQDPSV
jgi:hypothetical protein